MWPTVLNMTRDECRLTLRRLELEAYSNMMNVFRAQGAFEDRRKKLLEELRAVLHISHDRHSAEARRVSNDQLLATIADQLAGPNTGIGWICQGRRRVPLLPRGVPQTAYTEIADKAAEAAAAENREIQKRLEEKLVAPKSSEEEIPNAEGQTAEGTSSSNDAMYDEDMYPPVAMEDQTMKLWDTELITRKRKLPEGGAVPDDASTPIKNMRNIPVNTNQKHLNLSQIYSKFSQPSISKPPSQSKHSYNQVSKVSTSKSNQPHAPRSQKPRAQKAPRSTKISKSQAKKSQEVPLSLNKQYNASMQLEYAGPPNTFQASYAQAVLGNKTKLETDEYKPKVMSSPGMVSESPTMQLLTQPATVPHDLDVSDNVHPDDITALQAQGAPSAKHTQSALTKPVHHLSKTRSDIVSEKRLQPSELVVTQRSTESMKVLSNRPVVVAPGTVQKVLSTAPQKVMTATPQKVLGSTPQKVLSAQGQKVLSAQGKLVTTKIIGSIPKARPSTTPMKTEKMIVVSKPMTDTKNLSSSRVVVTSSALSTSMKERSVVGVSAAASNVARLTESLTPKGIPATDLKVSAKALVLNPKSGQKMVVVPANSRTKPGKESERQIPLIHFKGIPTAMKLMPVSSQSVSQVSRPSTVTALSKPAAVSSLSSTTKIIGMEPIKTANLADIVPVKGLTPVTMPKITNPIVRPSSAKGNVIVVQKGTPIGKALTFTKNGNDMSKIIMGKNVTQLLQASKTEHAEAGKPSGNVIVLELNNEQSGRPTTMSEILDSRSTGSVRLAGDNPPPQITADTPVLFDNRLTDETCNTSSLDSTVESIGGIVPLEEATLSIIEKETKTHFGKDPEGVKDSSSVTDWEMELDTVSRKDKDEDDKLNSLHLDLGMSSDSDGEYMGTGRKRKGDRDAQPRRTGHTAGEGAAFGAGAMSLATRTLLSQLQDDGSSSNDSSFALKAKAERPRRLDAKLDGLDCDELTKAKEKLSEKVAEAKSQRRRIDVYSTAIATSDINLDSFAYLDEGMLASDDVFATDEGKARDARRDAIHDTFSRLLGEDSASTDSQPVTDSIPINK